MTQIIYYFKYNWLFLNRNTNKNNPLLCESVLYSSFDFFTGQISKTNHMNNECDVWKIQQLHDNKRIVYLEPSKHWIGHFIYLTRDISVAGGQVHQDLYNGRVHYYFVCLFFPRWRCFFFKKKKRIIEASIWNANENVNDENA